jgi:hypothetical protein
METQRLCETVYPAINLSAFIGHHGFLGFDRLEARIKASNHPYDLSQLVADAIEYIPFVNELFGGFKTPYKRNSSTKHVNTVIYGGFLRWCVCKIVETGGTLCESDVIDYLHSADLDVAIECGSGNPLKKTIDAVIKIGGRVTYGGSDYNNHDTWHYTPQVITPDAKTTYESGLYHLWIPYDSPVNKYVKPEPRKWLRYDCSFFRYTGRNIRVNESTFDEDDFTCNQLRYCNTLYSPTKDVSLDVWRHTQLSPRLLSRNPIQHIKLFARAIKMFKKGWSVSPKDVTKWLYSFNWIFNGKTCDATSTTTPKAHFCKLQVQDPSTLPIDMIIPTPMSVQDINEQDVVYTPDFLEFLKDLGHAASKMTLGDHHHDGNESLKLDFASGRHWLSSQACFRHKFAEVFIWARDPEFISCVNGFRSTPPIGIEDLKFYTELLIKYGWIEGFKMLLADKWNPCLLIPDSPMKTLMQQFIDDNRWKTAT